MINCKHSWQTIALFSTNTKIINPQKTIPTNFRTFVPNYDVNGLPSQDSVASDRHNRIHFGLAVVDSVAQSIGQVRTIKSINLDDNGIYTFVPANAKKGK